MKSLTILFSAALLLFSGQRAPAAEAPLTVAVFNFQTAGEKLANKGIEAALLLGTQLSTAPDLMLVERQELEKALGEQELGLSGTVSPETAAKVGALSGAKFNYPVDVAGGAGGVTGAAAQPPTSPLPCSLKRSSPPAPRNLDPV